MTLLDIEMWLKGESFDESKDGKEMIATVTFTHDGEKVSKESRNIPVKEGDDPYIYEIKLEHKKEPKVWQMNKTSQRSLAEIFGRDMKKWIGKKAVLVSKDQVVGKTTRKVIYVKGEETRLLN